MSYLTQVEPLLLWDFNKAEGETVGADKGLQCEDTDEALKAITALLILLLVL